ncbi:MAG: hypothetical protein N2510_08745, partial [Ignavibacteria bacterium]|nr:hypothetical protein [Ignavibacteria bacterium]
MNDSGKTAYLGKTLLKLEIRSSDGSLKKLFLINLSFLLPGIFIPWLLNMQKASPFEFGFVTFLLFSLLMIFTVINEIDNILLSKNESEIFRSLPLGPQILSGAKMFMLTRFTLLMALPLLVPSSVFYYLNSGSFKLSLVYIINGYIASYFLINITILLYASAVRNFRITRSSNMRLFIQLVMIVTLILGFQFISYGITGKGSISSFINWLIQNRIIDFIPSSWFAFALSTEKYVFNLPFLVKIITPYMIFFFSYLSLK